MLNGMRSRLAWILLGCLCVLHLLVIGAHLQRNPAIIKTFHDHDVHVLQSTLVLAGERRSSALPVRDILPMDTPSTEGVGSAELMASALANSPENTRLYQTILPLHTLVVSLPSVFMGLSPMTLRLGTLPLLWALLLVVFDLGRHREDRGTSGLAAAILLGSLPAVFMGTLIGTPVLGNMLGATLPVWALIRSNGLSRLRWALLAGICLALAPRWGESAGDGMEALLVSAGPLCVVTVHVLVNVLRTPTRVQGLWGILGLGVMAVLISLLMDRWWLALHLSEYLLSEAGSMESTATIQRIGDLLGTLMVRPWDYPEALLWSLMGPVAVAVVGLGAVLSLRRPSWETTMLWSAALGPLVVLTLSAKRQDYYIAPILPALSVLGARGLVQLGGVWVVGATASMLVWLGQAHADLDDVAAHLCRPMLRTMVAIEPTPCGVQADSIGLSFGVYHYFRKWRAAADIQDDVRERLTKWAMNSAWFMALPPRSAVWIQRPMGQGGGADALYFVLQSKRPDLQIHILTNQAIDPIAEQQLATAPQIWLLTLVPRVVPPISPPENPITALRAQATTVERSAFVHRHQLAFP